MARGGPRFGAGRPGWHVKAEHCLRLDVRELARRRLLAPMCSFGWHWTDRATGERVGSIGASVTVGEVCLGFSVNGSPTRQRVPIERTPCTYGGSRPWFRCPNCGRRVAVLFLCGRSFACRDCGLVVYSSQSEDACGRAWRRQSRLEAKLGDNWARPKGMHNRTRERILAAVWDCQAAREEWLAGAIDRLFPRLKAIEEEIANWSRR